MKALVIVRHAKSSWDFPLDDFNRPLSQSGMRDARLVASEAKQYLPETFVIWSSKAKRAADTAIIFAQEWNFPIESIVFKETLYTFDERELHKIIQSCPDSINNLVVFGHNEAVTNFVNQAATLSVGHISTAGFVLMNFNTNSWEKLSQGVIKKSILPRDLR